MLFLLVSSAAASWTLGPSGRLGEPLGPRLVGAHSAFDATLTTATARSRCVSPLLAAAGETSFDYLVIGGGSGGISSARHAAAHGAKVAVISEAASAAPASTLAASQRRSCSTPSPPSPPT